MRIAIKYDDIDISSGGRVAGHEAGDTLVRRLLRIFPESIVIAPVPRQSEDFDVVPLEGLDPTDLVVINMDAVDSPHVWQVLSRAPGTAPGTVAEPRIMNFVWRPMPSDAPRAHMATLALSCALFPTFADSQRTANEVRELVAKWTAQHLYEKSRLSWVNLGFRLDHIQPRTYSDVPIVLYPSIYLTRGKHPEQFFRVIEQVRRAVPLRVEMRLQEDSLVSEAAMSISQRDWVWMGPLTATRRSYWEALARTTAFLATADKESYGLLYVEALGAGVIGVLPLHLPRPRRGGDDADPGAQGAGGLPQEDGRGRRRILLVLDRQSSLRRRLRQGDHVTGYRVVRPLISVLPTTTSVPTTSNILERLGHPDGR